MPVGKMNLTAQFFFQFFQKNRLVFIKHFFSSIQKSKFQVQNDLWNPPALFVEIDIDYDPRNIQN